MEGMVEEIAHGWGREGGMWLILHFAEKGSKNLGEN